MKVAIVAPSHVPFMVGGAEKLWTGLLSAFGRFTRHACELFKIPAKENSFWEVIDSYKLFYKLDVSEFDLVITSKYPAWMCRHPNHILYMQHTLRGLYDLYGGPAELRVISPRARYVWDVLGRKSTTTENIFDALEYLRETVDDPAIYDFPGPFIRRAVQALDRNAMAGVRKFMAISKTVADRKSYFPAGAEVEVVHHPTNLMEMPSIDQEYFFTVSRLDYAKRIDLLIKAYLLADVDVPFKIAGTGPHEKELKELARGCERIEFLGFTSDEDIEEHYRHALVVPFIPYEEDYGLIAVEAMKASKPVITCIDSGGSLELVTEQNGWICEPTVESLANAFREGACNPERARLKGEDAFRKVKHINWKETALKLAEAGTPIPKVANNARRKKILALSTYPIYPPRGGGQNRLFYLYKELAPSFDVEYLGIGGQTAYRQQIAPNVWQSLAAFSGDFIDTIRRLDAYTGTATGDVAFLKNGETMPEYIKFARKLAENVDLIVLEQPYCYPVAIQLGKKFVFSTQNVEWLMKKEMYNDNENSNGLLELIKATEKEAYKKACRSIFCSESDLEVFEDNFGMENSCVISNGYDAISVCYFSPEERSRLRREAGLCRHVVLFIGSWHKPNIDAVECIIAFAGKLPEYDFVVLGGVADYFKERELPGNLKMPGIVDDNEKERWLSIASVAVNPMLTGSGTNLKMLDYMGAGLPVVSTERGARGHILDERIFLCREIEDFPEAIKQAIDMDTLPAYNYANTFYSWRAIGRDYLSLLQDIFLKSNFK